VSASANHTDMHAATRNRMCWVKTAIRSGDIGTLSSLSVVPGCRAWKKAATNRAKYATPRTRLRRRKR
jgi:hypothetical protein